MDTISYGESCDDIDGLSYEQIELSRMHIYNLWNETELLYEVCSQIHSKTNGI